MKFLEHPIKEYIVNWNDHLTTFWTPIIVGVIFLGLAIHSITQKNIRMAILYIVLMLCCIGYLAFGDELIGKLTSLYSG